MEEIILKLMTSAPSYSEIREATEFGYYKIVQQIWEDDEYKLIRTNNWVETYNLYGILGGYSNESYTDELIKK